MERLAIRGGVPVLDQPHTPVWPRITADHVKVITATLVNDAISYYGREGHVEALEDAWSARLGGRSCLAVSSGTAALHSGYFALGAERGEEVIVPTNTFLATVMPLIQCGAIPVLADAEGDTGNMDPEAVEALITPRTVGIGVTHLWGHPCNMDRLMEIARRHGLWLLEDCSHAHAAQYFGKEVGTFGDAAAFSFQGAKLVFAGQGGLLSSRDSQTHERAVLFGHFRVRSEQDGGALKKYASTGFGLNYRMHPLAAALAVMSTADLEERVRVRTRLHDRLTARLSAVPGLIPPITRAGCTRGAYYGYKVGMDGEWLRLDRSVLVEVFRAEGLDVSIPGSKPLHMLPFFSEGEAPVFKRAEHANRKYAIDSLPQASYLWRTTLSLPTFTFDDESSLVDKYAMGFEKVYAHLGSL